MYLDSVDVYLPSALEILHEIAETHDADIVRGGVAFVAEDFRLDGRKPTVAIVIDDSKPVPFDDYKKSGIQVYENIFCKSKRVKAGWLLRRSVKFLPRVGKLAATESIACFHRMAAPGDELAISSRTRH